MNEGETRSHPEPPGGICGDPEGPGRVGGEQKTKGLNGTFFQEFRILLILPGIMIGKYLEFEVLGILLLELFPLSI